MMDEINSPSNRIWVNLSLVIIFLTAVFFRFYNYANRWGLASDQARDAIIIERSIQLHSLPLIGPFSASGPFVFGPSWYIFFIIFTSLIPNWLLTPWIIQSIIFTLTVFIMIKIGKDTEQIGLGLLLGIFTAISTAQISLSTNLIFSALVSCVSVVCLYYFLQCFKKDTGINFFLLGLFIAVAITVHFQAIPLLLFLLVAWIQKRMKIQYIIFGISGFIIPFIPLIIFDTQTHFFESSHLLQYFLFNNVPTVQKRWLTYVGQEWPGYWGNVIGGNALFGGIIMSTVFLVSGYQLWKKQMHKEIIAILIVFVSIFIMLRYFRGILFEGFLSFLHPLILLITAWVCLRIVKMNKVLGVCFILLIIFSTLVTSMKTILYATNDTDKETLVLKSFIEKKYPNKHFALYDYQYGNTSQSLPLSLFIYMSQENDPTGIRIGLANRIIQDPVYPLIYHTEIPYPVYLYDLNRATVGDIKQDNWIFVNPRAVYKAIEEWYK